MKTTNKTKGLVEVNNSSSEANKIFKVIIIMLLLLSPILVSCQSNSNSNSNYDCEDFSKTYKVNIKDYKNYNPTKGVEANFMSIANERAAIYILELDEKLGFELWDFISDWDSPDMFIEMPFKRNKLSKTLAITPIVATYPGDPDMNKSDDERETFLSSRNKNMWFVDFCENNRNYHYIFTEKDKNNPRIVVESHEDGDKGALIINILIRKDVPEKELNEFTYKAVMKL